MRMWHLCVQVHETTKRFAISVTDMIDGIVADATEVKFIGELLEGVLWNYGYDDIDEYDEVVAFLKDLGSFT